MMDHPELILELIERRLRVQRIGADQLEVVGNLSELTPEIQHSLVEHRDLFLQATHWSGKRSVRIGSHEFEYSRWKGEILTGDVIALDTETEVIVGREIPRLALVTVSDGRTHYLIHPDDFRWFQTLHETKHLVCHNAAFDWWVLYQHLHCDVSMWIDLVDDGRLHDTMILDALLRLAKNDAFPSYRDLARVAKEYCDLPIDKSDPYRLRYGEIIGSDWQKVDEAFFLYATKDAIVTHLVFREQQWQARDLIHPFQDQLLPNAVRQYGFLTESLQVKAAIVLDHVSKRAGLRLDQDQVTHTQERLGAVIDSAAGQIMQLPVAANLFKRDKDGQIKKTAKSGKPCMHQAELVSILTNIEQEHEEVTIPRTAKRGLISTSVREWSRYANVDPFVATWTDLEETAKLHQFFSGLQDEQIFPKYKLLVRTGRTSCSDPNIQQLPRKGGFREMVIPSPGHYFFTIDYSAIELRTLAAILEHRCGASQLAEVFRQGVDPHVHTAAMFAGKTLAEFNDIDSATRKTLRQRAKALNFGIPGGLGVGSLVSYAANTYGVKLSPSEASQFRDVHTSDVYPELAQYLSEDIAELLAYNLRVKPSRVRVTFPRDSTLGAVRKIIRDNPRKANGEPYESSFIDRVWNALCHLNCNPSLQKQLDRRDAGDRLHQQLFFGPVVTMTGRIRGRVRFSQARNTPFQGLAADGAKLALWNLFKAGYHIVAFVHDEVVIELPADADHTAAAADINHILCSSMQEVTPNIPIKCEYSLTDRWYKDAEEVRDADGRLVLWVPQ